MLCRSEMSWPELGAATTTVPGVTLGGGVGESDRKSGWMCASLSEACSVKAARCAWMVFAEMEL
jgi:hypothetical protein